MKLTGHEFTVAIVLNENLLQFEEDVPAHRLALNEELGREPGFALCTLEDMHRVLGGSRDEDPDEMPDTALVVAKDLNAIQADDVHGIVGPRFDPVEIQLSLQQDEHSRPFTQKCTVFRVGGRHLHYADYQIPKIDITLSPEITMNYAVYRREVSDTVWRAVTDTKGGEKAIETLVTRVIGKTNLPTDNAITHWAPPKEDTKDPWGES